MRVSTDERGVMTWALQDHDPPWTLPWGTVYPPFECSTHDPDESPDACHGRTGTYSKRVFVISVPSTRELCVVVEPGGTFSSLGTGWWSRDCPHNPWR